MPLQASFLDSGPLGLVTQRPGKSQAADDCRAWAENLNCNGVLIFVPEIPDYEVRRELIQTGNTAAVARLEAFSAKIAGRYLPLNTPAVREAARLWAEVRNAGLTTAPPLALDGDVILAAQVLQFCTLYQLPLESIVVASVNVRHIARFVPSEMWQDISLDNSGDEETAA